MIDEWKNDVDKLIHIRLWARSRVLYELDMKRNTITNNDRYICAPNLHFCPDWDFLPIDSMSPEYEGCTCYR